MDKRVLKVKGVIRQRVAWALLTLIDAQLKMEPL